MEHNIKIKNKIITLHPIKDEHIEMLRKQRNNNKNSKYLRKINFINKKDQAQWFYNYLNDNTTYGFIIYENNKLKKDVGSIFLYDIKYMKKEATIGRVIIGNKEAHNMRICENAILLLSKFAFNKLNINKIIANINVKNISSIISFIKAGFIIYKKEEMNDGNVQYLLYKISPLVKIARGGV